jgi:thiol:disulfide interchange protein
MRTSNHVARRSWFAVTLAAFLFLPTAWPQFPSAGFDKPSIHISTAWSTTAIKPGSHGTLAVVLEIPEPYHIYSSQVEPPYIPTTIRVSDAPTFLRSSTAVFPPPKEINLNDDTGKHQLKAYSGKVIAYVPIALNASALPGKTQLAIQIGYQACNDKICLQPAKVVQTVSLEVADVGTVVKPLQPELFSGMQESVERLNIPFFGRDFQVSTSKLWLLLMVAALGGFLLNLTPCVLPLLPLKVMALSHGAGNRRKCLALGFVMSAGVVGFWLLLAGAICTVSGFNSTNKLFQYPAFTLSVGVIICVMAVGMSGLFSVRLPAWVYSINPSHDSFGGALTFGVMTAVLSTPCTAPFMGAAAAWSATQKPVVTLATFAAIGSGMAFPYLLLSVFPALVRKVPRTGQASDLVKQVMGLLMLAAGAYFLGTGLAGMLVRPPDPAGRLYWWLVATIVAAAGLRLTWRTAQITKRLLPRAVFGTFGLLMAVTALVMSARFTRMSPVHWTYFTPERLVNAQGQGKPVLLELTAEWCLNCHALEQGVLHRPEVVRLLNSGKLVPMKVDLTGNNPAGDQKLVEAGSRTIPYLTIVAADGKQVFASDAYTVEQLVNALEKLAL